jgi:hypothetical protein
VIPVNPIADAVVIAGDPDKKVLDLPAVLDPDGAVVTKWALDDEDRRRIAEGGHVWIVVKTLGQPLQPLFATTTPLIEVDEDGIEEGAEDYDRSAFPETLKHVGAPSVGRLAEEEPLEDVLDESALEALDAQRD